MIAQFVIHFLVVLLAALAFPIWAQENPNFSDFVSTTTGGLTMQLPKELSSLTEERDSGGELELLEKYTSVWTTRSCIIKHFIFKAPRTISPREAADLTENDLKDQPKYSATRRAFNASGIDGLILEARYKGMGQNVEQSILYFSRGHEMWEVHLFGVSDQHPDALKEMKEKVFSSIKIKS